MNLMIGPADLADPAVQHIIHRHIAHGETAYPSESNHHLDPAAHKTKNVALFGAWIDDVCLGMIGLMRMNATAAEVKSMHVMEAARGRGVARGLLVHVMDHAKGNGTKTLYLETGSREASAAARKLYETYGFEYCPPFADYTLDPESEFMRLDLEPAQIQPS